MVSKRGLARYRNGFQRQRQGHELFVVYPTIGEQLYQLDEHYPQSSEITPQSVCSNILGAAQDTCQGQISYISHSGTVSSNSNPVF